MSEGVVPEGGATSDMEEACRALVKQLPELQKNFRMRKMLILMHGFGNARLVEDFMSDVDRLRQLLLGVDCKNRAAMLLLAEMYDTLKCFSDAFGIRLWIRHLFPSVPIEVSPPEGVRGPCFRPASGAVTPLAAHALPARHRSITR